MRSNTLLLVATSLAASVYASFGNTAPLLVSSSKYDKRACKYIQSVTAAADSILSLTEDICLHQEDNDDLEKLLYLRIHGLDNNDINKEFINYFDVDSKLHMLSNHIVYKENQDNAFIISPSCGDALTINTKNDESDEDWINALLASKSNVNIINFYKSPNLAESLSKLSMVFSAQNFIIQGLPLFESPDSLLDSAALKLKYFLGNQKRHNQEEEVQEMDYESIGKELEEAFEEVNSLLEEETVTIYKSNDDIKDQYSSSSGKPIIADGSLFDRYGFFSSGIWMGTIVSLFIFWLLSVSLSWLGSMQISYRAFDKPVNVEKKMQ